MSDVAAIAWRLFRRRTGYGLRHLVALTVALIGVVGVLAVPFWWLAEQGQGIVGVGGFVIAAALYLSTLAVVLATCAVIVTRRVIRRLLAA
jgi:hypothetical protein